MRRICLFALVTGCTDAVVDLQLVLPPPAEAAAYDASCVQSVDVYVNGATYPADERDYVLDCEQVEGVTSFADVRAAIAGRFALKFPASGLSGVELYAYSGPCNAARRADYDLSFYASAPYIGQDPMELPVIPNASCAPIDVTVRPIDVLKLVATRQCDQAVWTYGNLALSTFSPMPFNDETYWWGGQASAPIVYEVARLKAPSRIGPQSCLAAGVFDNGWNQATCVSPDDQRICTGGGEIEVPMIDSAVAVASQNQAKVVHYGGLLIGAIYGSAPIAGATVTIDDEDKDKGAIVYFDMPAGVENGVGGLAETSGTSTGVSGLFGIYTQSLVHITITANGKQVRRVVGVAENFAAAALVKI